MLHPDTKLDARASHLLRVPLLQAQPDPLAKSDAPNVHVWLGKMVVWAVVALALDGLYRLLRRKR